MPRVYSAAARSSSESLGIFREARICGRSRRRLPNFFVLAVGEEVGRAVVCTVVVVCGDALVTGVIGPGVSGAVGALALGAESDDTTKMAMTRSAVSAITVMAARNIPRRGFGVGLLPKKRSPAEEVNAPVYQMQECSSCEG